ncbi:hypothetical protein [Alkalicoccus chagannorensis]|uniref:hypothetical protein n=1 Tax=Alkalicoccus chagannorensis TaxID=427072 RepID=UPI0004199933|nr:hypothetical protein [Alkalicoccus chagannorensis]
MPKQKLIVLIAGAVVLVILSAVLMLTEDDREAMNSEDEPQLANEETASSEPAGETDDAGASSGNAVNIDSSEPQEEEASISEEREEQLREAAEEALDTFTPDVEEPFTYEAFEGQALVQSLYQSGQEEGGTISEDMETNAEWLAVELSAWRDHAEDAYGFSFDQASFEAYVEEQENVSLEGSAEVMVLVDTLNEAESSLGDQQLHYQYGIPFIWHEIQDEAAGGESPEATTELNALFYEEQQEVFERIQSENPDMMEGETPPE